MFGWELPPYNSGGLGTACLGLTEELAPLGVDIDFVVPKLHGPLPFNHMNVLSASDFTTVKEIEEILKLNEEEQQFIAHNLGYGNRVTIDSERRMHILNGVGSTPVLPSTQASWYAYQAAAIAKQKHFEVVHCHDWMTYSCGIAAKKVAEARGEHVPFIAHIHATEVDRCGGIKENGDPRIMAIEEAGLQAADRVVAVSNYTKHMVHKHYGIPLSKISVVHNGLPHKSPPAFDFHELKKHYKIVLSMGRLTIMKGPDYFIKLAKAVTDLDPKVKFVLVGSGDMEKRCIEEAAALGLTGKILFSSFLRGKDVDRAFQLADIFVMPSVSEPFGLVALEAMQNGTPVIASKQSGVIEVTDNLIPVDFWDVEAMKDAVFKLLYEPGYSHQMVKFGKEQLPSLSWKNAAHKMQAIYKEMSQSIQTAHA